MRLRASKTKEGFRIGIGEYFETNDRVFRVLEKSGAIGRQTIYQFGKPVQVLSVDEERSTYLIEDAITRQRYTMPLAKINQRINEDLLWIITEDKNTQRRRR